MTDETLREVAMLEDIEKTTNEHVLTLAWRVEVQRAQRMYWTVLRKLRNVITSGKTSRNGWTHTLTKASIVEQDLQFGSTLHIKRNVEYVAKPAISRWSADPCSMTEGTMGQEGSWWDALVGDISQTKQGEYTKFWCS